MKDSTLIKISLFTFIFGILGLVYLDLGGASFESPVRSDDLDNVIQGKVVNLRVSKSTIRVSVLTNTSIKSVVVFSDNRIDIKEGDLLKIRYQQSEYNDRIELIADSVTKLS